jgi:hypothetical protein
VTAPILEGGVRHKAVTGHANDQVRYWPPWWRRRESNPGPQLLHAQSCHEHSCWMYYLGPYQQHPSTEEVPGIVLSGASRAYAAQVIVRLRPTLHHDDQGEEVGRDRLSGQGHRLRGGLDEEGDDRSHLLLEEHVPEPDGPTSSVVGVCSSRRCSRRRRPACSLHALRSATSKPCRPRSGPTRSRTGDLRRAKPALSQLSYRPKRAASPPP